MFKALKAIFVVAALSTLSLNAFASESGSNHGPENAHSHAFGGHGYGHDNSGSEGFGGHSYFH